MIKVILWDIDGTLLNFEKAEKHAIKRCFSIFGLGECTDEMVARYSVINQSYWKRLERGEISKKDVLVKRFEEFFAHESIDFSDVEAFNGEYQVLLGEKVFFNDDGYSVVESLKERVKQYAVTNGTYIAQKLKLQKSGLIDLLDGVFISDKIGVEKPNIAFFDYVWEQIGDYAKNEIMIVGDSLTSDMQGGNNAGIVCCWYNPDSKEKTVDVKTDYEIRNLNCILDMI